MKTGRFCPSLWVGNKHLSRPVTNLKAPALPMDARHALEVMASTENIRVSAKTGVVRSRERLNLGFQSPSIRHNREAPIRLIPTPPAFDDNRKRTRKKGAYSAPKAK